MAIPVNSTNPLNQFLEPTSMITPGAAGGTVMLIASALNVNFSISTALAAIVLSFVFGLLCVVSAAYSIPTKALLYVINSLIIFCVATGSGRTLQNITGQTPVSATANISLPFIGSAYAQTAADAPVLVIPNASGAPVTIRLESAVTDVTLPTVTPPTAEQLDRFRQPTIIIPGRAGTNTYVIPQAAVQDLNAAAMRQKGLFSGW
jgi:hypothetical protein